MATTDSSLPTRKQKVALVQMTSGDDISKNVNTVMKQLSALEKTNPDVICLPENCLFLRVDRKSNVQAVTLKESFWSEFQSWCKSTKTHIFFGSVPLKGKEKLLNSTAYIDAKGELRQVYNKIHLFDVDVEGAPPSRESDNFEHGKEAKILNIDGWKWGLSICYDLRFSELYLKYAREGVHVISVPAAFLVPTGRAHWHTLLRARAIEAQAFVVAAAQSGEHTAATSDARRETFGHSLVVGPWGEILVEKSDAGEGAIVYDLDPEMLRKVRTQIPMSGHRRLQ